jgi:protoheme IX farnesyltransferase
LRDLLALTRYKVALAAALAATGGRILARGFSIDTAPLALGALLVAAGALALNQYQERDVDLRMERTRARPLPSGRMRPSRALRIAALLIAIGEAALAFSGGATAALIALVIVAGYNAVYTPLKRRTAFASVPGAWFGALPPMIGWVSAGESISSPVPWAVIAFLFLWQAPHVWLLSLAYPEDVMRSGLPNLVERIGRRGTARLAFSWIMAAIAAGLCLILFHPAPALASALVLASAGAWLTLSARSLLSEASFDGRRMRRLFASVNLFALIALTVFAIGGRM